MTNEEKIQALKDNKTIWPLLDVELQEKALEIETTTVDKWWFEYYNDGNWNATARFSSSCTVIHRLRSDYEENIITFCIACSHCGKETEYKYEE